MCHPVVLFAFSGLQQQSTKYILLSDFRLKANVIILIDRLYYFHWKVGGAAMCIIITHTNVVVVDLGSIWKQRMYGNGNGWLNFNYL